MGLFGKSVKKKSFEEAIGNDVESNHPTSKSRGPSRGKPPKKQKTMRKTRSIGLRNLVSWMLIIGVILIAFMGLQMNAATYRKTVNVVSLNEQIGNRIIQESYLASYSLVERDVQDDMVLWKDREEIVGMYPTMTVRPNTPVYKDMFTEEQVMRHRYLYEMQPDEELLTFVYNRNQAAGRIPRPGDRFRIRGTYSIPEEERMAMIEQGIDPHIEDRSQVIFDVVTVEDMLNGNGDSIFEVYRQINALPQLNRDEALADNDIQKQLSPESLLIVVKSDDVDTYTNFEANHNVQYFLTLLTREESLLEEELRHGGSIFDTIGGDSVEFTPEN